MFGKIFSSKPSETPLEIKTTITELLESYRSDSFPHGVLAVCENLKISTIKTAHTVALTLPFPCAGELQVLADQLTEELACQVSFNIDLDVKAVRQHGITKVANIIAISSGKGGVGKSTTTVNLAYALIAEGAKVGVLDADIYGPSIPTMLGLKGHKPQLLGGKFMLPPIANKLYAMSIDFLIDADDATVWRGPMASKAFGQLLTETAWPELDYLLIDMPPGTGDIQITLAQQVPVAAATVVTTPQDIALIDAIKGIAMFKKVAVPVLGIIENMSYHICDNCGHHSHLFGQDGGKDIAEKYQTNLLGQLPLDITIRENADLGQPSVFENSTSDISQKYRKIARNMAAQLYLQLDRRSVGKK